MNCLRWMQKMTIDEMIALQKQADDLALRLEGDDQLLVWKLRSTVEQLAERLAKVRTLAG